MIQKVERAPRALPKELSEPFISQTLKEGRSVYSQRKVAGLDFFRVLHRGVIEADGHNYECFYWHVFGKNLKLSERTRCFCDLGKRNILCKHVAALLYAFYDSVLEPQVPSGPRKIASVADIASAGWNVSLLKSVASAFCKSNHKKLPFSTLVDYSQYLLMGNVNKSDSVLLEINLNRQNLKKDSNLDPFPFHDPLPSHKPAFANLMDQELLPEDKNALAFTPTAPSVLTEFGMVGSIFRRLFLESPRWSGVLEAEVDSSPPVFCLRLKPDFGALEIKVKLLGDAAWSLWKMFGSQSNKPLIQFGNGIHELDVWRKAYQISLHSDGGLVLAPMLCPAQSSNVDHNNSTQWKQPDPNPDACFGPYLFIPDLGFRRVESGTSLLHKRFPGYKPAKVLNSDVTTFVTKYATDLDDTEICLWDRKGAPLHRQAAWTKLLARVESRSAGLFVIDMTYTCGGADLPLNRILEARTQGLNSLLTPEGWADFQAIELSWLDGLKKELLTEWLNQEGKVKLTKAKFLRVLGLMSRESIHIIAPNFPELETLGQQPLNHPNGKSSVEGTEPNESAEENKERSVLSQAGLHLRPYQQHGLQWLWHLWRCGVSGILADEMGLGKTHQAMALIDVLFTLEKKARILIVCPTSVLYHWRDKFKKFYPKIPVRFHHGVTRDPVGLKEHKGVLLTSHGVARSDQDFLAMAAWDLLVVDEAQLCKNSATELHRALCTLSCHSIIALTGTPLENSPADIKGLFDLLLPGYFPEEAEFRRLILDPWAKEASERAKALFLRLTSPFLLRRAKAEVLLDLPDKTESTMFCEATPIQRKLYQEAETGEDAKKATDDLKSEVKVVSYLHVFALLNKLKRLCDHPFLSHVGKAPFEKTEKIDTIENSEQELDAGGKWPVFEDILHKSMEAGLKVVVFSQYLDLLAFLGSKLRNEKIGHSLLTGSTRDREGELRRFREDRNCKVFLCSLKAGGVGIDLTSASVAIHYDRWWNAAREDQATDRLHRIGQHRNVQVYKLAIEATVEERIDALITRKRRDTALLLKTDAPTGTSILGREELLELLGAKKN